MAAAVTEHSRTDAPAPRWHRHAWKIAAAAGASVFVYGASVLLDPSPLTSGFETYTGQGWSQLVGDNEVAADFVLVGFRLLGALNVVIGLLLVAIAIGAFRLGAQWAWWALLLGNTIAFGAPIIYDRIVGFVGVFEIIEYVLLCAVYVALAATAPMARLRPTRHGP